MFDFLKKQRRAQASASAPSMPLHFRDASAALEYACKYLDCQLESGIRLPAIVLDAREMFGTRSAVTTRNGRQLATLRVASSDGGFIVPAEAAGSLGPTLEAGRLVVWQAAEHSPDVAKVSTDPRFGWVGLILGTLRLEYDPTRGWLGGERFT